MADKVVDNQVDLFTDIDRDPRKYIYEALDWIVLDYPTVPGQFPTEPGRWLKFISLCKAEMKAGNPRIRRGDIYLLARQHGFTVSQCEAFRQDNNIWPALSRYALMYAPILAGVIRPNAQKWDDAGINWVAEWHSVIKRPTRFYFDDWRDAQAAYEAGDVSASW